MPYVKASTTNRVPRMRLKSGHLIFLPNSDTSDLADDIEDTEGALDETEDAFDVDAPCMRPIKLDHCFLAAQNETKYQIYLFKRLLIVFTRCLICCSFVTLKEI